MRDDRINLSERDEPTSNGTTDGTISLTEEKGMTNKGHKDKDEEQNRCQEERE